MTKRIVVLNVDGTERELPGMPTYEEMKAIVGGWIEHVRVLDHVAPDGLFVYTSMFVNEESLLHELPRNPKATEIYQRNARAAFPDAENPFRAITEDMRRRYGTAFIVITPPDALSAGYADDPWISGPAIFFDGWTREEVDRAMNDGED